MTLPTLTTLDGTTNAAEVLGNDEALVDTFGAFDITYNVTEILSPMIIGPVRRHFHNHADLVGEYALIWKVPSSGSQNLNLVLRELHINVPPTTSFYSQELDSNNYAVIKIDHAVSASSDAGTSLGTLTVNSAGDFTLPLTQEVSEGNYVRVITDSFVDDGGAGTDVRFFASISILAYMRHRTD